MDVIYLILLGLNLAVLVGIIYLLMRRRKADAAKGFPERDEFTRAFMHKTGFIAFWISFIMWLFIGFYCYYAFSSDDSMEFFLPLFGCMAMGIIYIVSGLVIRARGVM